MAQIRRSSAIRALRAVLLAMLPCRSPLEERARGVMEPSSALWQMVARRSVMAYSRFSRRPPNNPYHTTLQGTVVWMVVLVEHESNVMSDLDDRPMSMEC